MTLTLLRAVGDRFENVTCVLRDDLSELPYAPRAGSAHIALRVKDRHAIVDVAHDDDLSLGSGARDVRTRAVPVHVEEGDLQRFLAKEAEPHLLVLQDLFHRHEGVARVVLLCQLRHVAQDDEVTPAEARHYLASRLAGLAIVVFRVGAHFLAGFFRFKVVVVALTPSVDEGLALSLRTTVGPAWLIGFTGALQAGETAGARELWTAALHALLVCLEDLPGVLSVVVTVAVGKGEAVVGLGLVVPADVLQLTPTILWVVRGFQALLGEAAGHILWLRGYGQLCGHHSEGVVSLHRAGRVLSCAGVDTRVLWLGIVDDQLANVSDDHVPSHMIGPHDDPLRPLW